MGGCFSSLHLIFYTDSTCYLMKGKVLENPPPPGELTDRRQISLPRGCSPGCVGLGGR